MSTIKMIQNSQHKWEIRSTQKNTLLQGDLNISNVDEAELYVKNYCTSFMNWTYEVVPLPRELTSKRSGRQVHRPKLVENPNIKTSEDMATMPALVIIDEVVWEDENGN